MAKQPTQTIKSIQTEMYRTDKKWYEFWRPKEYVLFIINYTDGSGRIYKAKRSKE